MRADLSLEKYSHIVEVIYSAALEPEHWRTFCKLLAEATGSKVGGVAIGNTNTMMIDAFFEYGAAPDYLARYNAALPFNPMLPSVVLCKPGDVLINSAITPEEDLRKSRFFEIFMQPLALRDAMTMINLRSGSRAGFFGVNRAEGSPLYEDADAEILRLVAPHVSRAMTISDAFDLKAIKSNGLESALGSLATAVFLLDAVGRVTYMNPSGEALVASDRVLAIRDGRLSPNAKPSRDALEAELAQGGKPARAAPSGEAAIPLHTANGGGMIATLLPLEQAGRGLSMSPLAARWAVFVQDPHVALPMPGEAFARLYNLTPAELRVAMALAPGLTPEEASAMLGIAMPTVRAHLQRIFIKTGASRQVDLVRLMMATMPPVAAQGGVNH